MPKLVMHHIDVLNSEYVAGWCFYRLLPSKAACITIKRAGETGEFSTARAHCSLPRQDVVDAGLHRSGRCGFLHAFDPPLTLESPSDHDGETLVLTAAAGLSTLLKMPTNDIKPALRTSKSVFFMHIPKTAGTSFNNQVQEWFGHQKWHIHVEAITDACRRALLQPDHYVAGHLPLYQINQLIDTIEEVNLHTFVRDPVSQLHSHLAWLKGIGSRPEDAFFGQHQAVVRELALEMQTRILGTPRAVREFVNQLDGFEMDFFDNIQTRYFLDYRPDKVTERDLQQALGNRALFATIGLTEQYQEGLDQFGRYYGREPEAARSRHNPTRVAPLFDVRDPEIASALGPLIEFDQLLYEAIVGDNAPNRSQD